MCTYNLDAFVKKLAFVFLVVVLACSLFSISASAARWYDPYITYAKSQDIIHDDFNPDEEITRGDALRILKATRTGAYCYTVEEARAWAVSNGYSDGLRMWDGLTRAEATTLVGRILDVKCVCALPYGDAKIIPPWAYQYVCGLTIKGTVNGMEDGNFHPFDTLVGSHWVTMMCRM